MEKNTQMDKWKDKRTEKKDEPFLRLLRECVSSYHTVLAAEKLLADDGFTELHMSDVWNLENPGKYYIKHRDSSLFAFTVGKTIAREVPVRIAAAHTDFPGLYIKADPQVKKHGFVQLNVEVYGGPILSTWLDRPLSAAGRVAIRSGHVMKPDIRMVDLKEPFCTIPNLAIHMNRETNKGVELNRQKDLLPIAGLESALNGEDSFVSYLADHMQVSPEDILDFDLYLYSTEEPEYIGMKQEFLSASHLDNTTSVMAILHGITGEPSDSGINVAALFDNEEVGSRTAQGAASVQLLNLLKKICRSLKEPVPEDILYESMMLSVDVAHGIHPNYPEKADIVLQPKLGNGFCIKEACAQSYPTDSSVIAVVQQICDKEGIPYQKYANRSDIPGGSTLGNIASAFLPIAIADIGVPLLAMHSIRELIGRADMEVLSKCIHAFYRA